MTESSEIDALVFKAKLAEKIERYEEMVEAMKSVVEKKKELTTEERNLLSVAYKNVIGTRRSSWRILNTIKNKEVYDNKKDVNLIEKYRLQLEKEMKAISNEILKLIEENLTIEDKDDESKVFYLKMAGDYYRYMAEFIGAEERKEVSDKSFNAYQKATDCASKNLQPTHPIRLGLALNFSVYYYEIKSDPNKACELAKSSFDEAIASLDALTEEYYKDSTLIMQLLRDNLTLWTTESAPNVD